MKVNIIYFLCFVIFLACNSGQNHQDSEIKKLEQEVATNPTAENSSMLLEKYKAYVDNNPEDHETNALYLNKAANLLYKQNKFSSSIQLLKQALKNHYEASNTPDNALLLASVYNEKTRNNVEGMGVYRAFLMAFPDHEGAKAAKEKIGREDPALGSQMDGLTQSMYSDSTGRINTLVARQFIGLAEIYAFMLPKDPQGALSLHKAGEVARSIRAYPKALELFDWICEKYPESEKAPQALFLKGFTYDNEMKNKDKAKEIYELFLTKYPNDDFADDTRFLLDNLQKSDEEIIQSFEKKTQ